MVTQENLCIRARLAITLLSATAIAAGCSGEPAAATRDVMAAAGEAPGAASAAPNRGGSAGMPVGDNSAGAPIADDDDDDNAAGPATTASPSASGGAPNLPVTEPDTGPTDTTPKATPPSSCAEAATAYELITSPLDAAFVPLPLSRSWAGSSARTPVAVAADGAVYVGFTRQDGAIITRSDGAADDAFVLEGAALGALVATADGVGALLFDPNDTVDDRTWAAVARLDTGGNVLFRTDLFRSPNLEDEGTKGGAKSGRLAYVATTDTLVPYFGHTQRYKDGVRHQGGYLATLDAAGTQTLVDGWFGSHNLSQRILVTDSRVAVLGLGDAFPKGIFFNYLQANGMRPRVVYALASDGVGSTNGSLGGMVDLESSVALPFITNRSIPQDLDAGPWPNTDQAISAEIRKAASEGRDIGLLLAPKTDLPAGDLSPIWIDAQASDGARLTNLESALYGPGLVLLAWEETSGDSRGRGTASSNFFTIVVDQAGTVCQPKTPLPAGLGFAPGDELVRAADGSILWASAEGERIQLVRLLPR